MTKLILLTVSFPYGRGEQFLENEIKYLTETFDEIIVIPAIIDKNLRPLPDNIRIDTGFAESHNILKILWSAVRSIDTYGEIVRHPHILTSIWKIQRLLSFMGRGYAQYLYLKKYYFFDSKTLYYSYWFNGSCYALYLLKKEKPIKYILRAHGSDLYIEANKGYLPFRKQVVHQANTVFCISQNGADYMKNTYALNLNTPIEVARLGADNCDTVNKTISPTNQQLHLVSCAHISHNKRIDLLISAIKILGKKNSSCQIYWTHIGSGPQFEEIKILSQSLPNNIHVNLLGHMNNKDIIEYYSKNNLELFVNTSKSEGLPVTFMEAMSCGIPVMAPSIGGIPEIVNNKNGILLSKNINASIVYKELQKALIDKESLFYKGIEARKTWEKEYNAEKNYKKFAKQLKAIISE